jgi:hypothetical protein
MNKRAQTQALTAGANVPTPVKVRLKRVSSEIASP